MLEDSSQELVLALPQAARLAGKSMYLLIQLTGPSVAFSKIDWNFDFEMLRAISEIVRISVLTWRQNPFFCVCFGYMGVQVHVCASTHVYACMWRLEVSPRYHDSGAVHLVFLWQNLPLAWTHPQGQAGWAVSFWHPRLACFCLPSSRHASVCHHAWIFMWMLLWQASYWLGYTPSSI